MVLPKNWQAWYQNETKDAKVVIMERLWAVSTADEQKLIIMDLQAFFNQGAGAGVCGAVPGPGGPQGQRRAQGSGVVQGLMGVSGTSSPQSTTRTTVNEAMRSRQRPLGEEGAERTSAEG